MIWAWIETSSALIGSSATMSSGFTARARATPMRCRWPPRELVRVAIEEVRVEADDVEQLGHPLASLGLRPDVVDAERLADDAPDRHPRVQARVGVLEDHLHPAPHLPELLALEAW